MVLILTILVTLAIACGDGEAGEAEVGEPAISTPEPTPSGILVSEVELQAPVWAGAVAVSPDGRLVAAVNPDSDSVTLVEVGTHAVVAEIDVRDDPRTLAFTPDSGHLLVANHGDASVSAIDIGARQESRRWDIGPRPYGIVTDGKYAYVTESALGNVSMIDLASGVVTNRVKVDESPTGIALIPNRGVFVTHLFTGRVTSLNSTSLEIVGQASTGRDTNLSQFIAIEPDGDTAYLPQTRSNSTNLALIFDTTVFPVVNVLDLESLTLSVRARITIDTADRPVNRDWW